MKSWISPDLVYCMFGQDNAVLMGHGWLALRSLAASSRLHQPPMGLFLSTEDRGCWDALSGTEVSTGRLAAAFQITVVAASGGLAS